MSQHQIEIVGWVMFAVGCTVGSWCILATLLFHHMKKQQEEEGEWCE